MCVICEQSALDDIKHLYVCKNAKLPIVYLPKVLRIDCYNNRNIKGRFTSDNFPNLKHLDISYTNTTSIDKNTLEKLKYLNARNTKLFHLPIITNCKIRELNLTNNNIKELPECYDNVLTKRFRHTLLK